MNVLLTGDINTGKSRLIDVFLKEYSGSIVGFKTLRAKTDIDAFFGIYLLDVRNLAEPLTKQNRIGTCFEDKTLVCHDDVLEKAGTAALTFDTLPSLIVLDEIGVLEKNCAAFTNKITECLDSQTNVLGVIKKKRDRFLDSIIDRNDVIVIDVQGKQQKKLLELIKRYLSV